MVHRHYSQRSHSGSQCAAGAPARLSDRFRPRSRRPHVQNMLVRRGSNKQQPRQAHSERLCRTCTHAPTKLGSASRGHGRPACTQEAHPQPISTRARPLRHCDCELAADVAVARDARDGCTPTLLERVAPSVADLDGDTATCVERVPVKEPSRAVAARPRARYTRPPSRKHLYTVDLLMRGAGHKHNVQKTHAQDRISATMEAIFCHEPPLPHTP